MSRESLVLELAHEVGFDLAGIAPLAPPPAAGRFQAWLDAGRHGDMEWLERDRERIADPRQVLPEGGSIVVVGLAHSRAAVELSDGARVARYAAGRDYHNVVLHKLRKLNARLQREGFVGRQRRIVDAGPVLERSHAAVAGIGFESKAANLLHPRFGPWFFLAEILLGHELAPTTEVPPGSCGTCTACLDACPTAAIVEPGVVDARRCISYHTIENKGAVPDEFRAEMGRWAFGCDVCSEVCPWGAKAPDLAARFGLHSALADQGLVEWLEAGPEFEARFHGSPIHRPGRERIARNAAIGLGTRPTDAGRKALLRALSFDPSSLVREAAGWGLAHGFGRDQATRAALERAAQAETSPEGRARLAAHRDACDRPAG
jgi:epoxyqueuosine reductase